MCVSNNGWLWGEHYLPLRLLFLTLRPVAHKFESPDCQGHSMFSDLGASQTQDTAFVVLALLLPSLGLGDISPSVALLICKVNR